jgi:hypothetical protein
LLFFWSTGAGSWPSVDIDVDRVAVAEYVRARHPA